MDKELTFWQKHGWFFAALAIVLGVTSLGMNLLSHALESTESPAPSAAPGEYWVGQEETNVINVLSAGAVQSCSSANPEGVFDGLGTTVKNYEVSSVSMHTLVGTDSSSAFAQQVLDQGFTHFGLAYPNVHAFGKDAIDASMNYWNGLPVRTSGTNVSTDEKNILRTSEVNGISVIYLSFTDILNDELPENELYLVNQYDDEKTPLFVNKAAEQADLVIVSIAWEGEQGALPNERQKEVAQALAGAGASIIVGYSDNAVQPVAWIDDTLVFYSLGNLYCEEKETADCVGAIGAVTVTETNVNGKGRIELTNPRVDLIVSLPQEEGGAKVVMLKDAGEDQVPASKMLYSGYVDTLQRMDDSIRIGGLK